MFLCQPEYVNGNPSGSRSEIRSKRPLWRSGSSSAVNLLTDRTLWTSLCSTTQITLIAFLRHPGFRNNSILFLGNPRGPKIRLIFGNRKRHHCVKLRPRPKCNFIYPRQLDPFPERLELPFSNDEILCGYEEIDSSGTGQFTAWVKMSDHEILVGHMVDILKATAEFREASERKPATSSHMNSTKKHFATRSVVQRRLSIYNWNPGPRRGKEDAFQKQIAGKWRVITLQEASDYVDHELLTNRFHVTHYAGCAILFNKDTFYPNVDVKSIYLHDTRRELPDQIMEGEQGWVLQGVLSRASFRRSPVSGQKYITVLSLHINNIYAKKKGIAKKLILTLRAIMISQEVDLVAGDFNGTAWRYRSKDNLSTIDEAFTDSTLPTPPGRTPLRGPGSIPDMWADVCGFLKPPGSQRFWKGIKHGAFSIPRKTLGLRPNDQSCHHETWLHLDFVDWSNTWPKHDVYEQRISLESTTSRLLIRRLRYGNSKRRMSEVMSDHSLSS